jgi:hypothetical protein
MEIGKTGDSQWCFLLQAIPNGYNRYSGVNTSIRIPHLSRHGVADLLSKEELHGRPAGPRSPRKKGPVSILILPIGMGLVMIMSMTSARQRPLSTPSYMELKFHVTAW